MDIGELTGLLQQVSGITPFLLFAFCRGELCGRFYVTYSGFMTAVRKGYMTDVLRFVFHTGHYIRARRGLGREVVISSSIRNIFTESGNCAILFLVLWSRGA